MSAKKIIMNLLTAHRGEEMSVKNLIDAASILGIAESNVRVTLARLKQDDLVATPRRGYYKFGRAAEPVRYMVASWKDADSRIVTWDGSWCAAHVAGLSRADRTQVKYRERALRLFGMRELDAGLFVRPNNLKGGIDSVIADLRELGLERDAPVFQVAWFEASVRARAEGLWAADTLHDTYRNTVVTLDETAQLLPSMPLAAAAQKAYNVGNDTIRQIVFDPLLPEPLVDARLRHHMIESMRDYNAFGLFLWQAIFDGYALDTKVLDIMENEKAEFPQIRRWMAS